MNAALAAASHWLSEDIERVEDDVRMIPIGHQHQFYVSCHFVQSDWEPLQVIIEQIASEVDKDLTIPTNRTRELPSAFSDSRERLSCFMSVQTAMLMYRTSSRECGQGNKG